MSETKLTAKYKRDTKRKHRYDAESHDGNISVGIYITKGTAIPKEITVKLITTGGK